MTTFLFTLFCVALLAAFIIIFMDRTGLRELVIATAPKLISQLFDCDFCLSWWVSIVLAVGAAVCMWDAALLLVPFLSTPVTRFLL
ncbi:hypothetical protein [Alistipes finegoldii]|jgi:hypothetical protein|uniref:hypothetical protein n=1 Tax=Alistipes finegoldii TaxID=214856 RepID=UPI002069B1AC|nr:MAG TPA: Protein of unknown function (DUF1360) [Caudoviricetes sp.]